MNKQDNSAHHYSHAQHSIELIATCELVDKEAAGFKPSQGLKRVLTYGTFDLLHYGHIRLLKHAAALGDYLIVALSTDKFNASKGKKGFYPYEIRKEMLESIRYVDLVIPEYAWGQKPKDIRDFNVDIVCMGSDWQDDEHFERLKQLCEVIYLPRTKGISTTDVKQRLHNS